MKSLSDNNHGAPLAGIRVCDLSRVLAGPSCTQLLGDLGADVIKVERPHAGDDTRAWGPPFLKGPDGVKTKESAYFLSANRNKRSVAIDFSTPKGQELVRSIAAESDILVENFKLGGLNKLGLGYATLSEHHPGLIYCSITGFGQSGPYAPRAGYDLLIQAMGGIMSITGQADAEPTKVGVAIADTMCGMYATVAILSALRTRDQTGLGQHIDMSLLDTQVAWLGNQGLYYTLSGETPPRLGNAHPTVVPYQVFESADGHVILGIGNDGQFARFCAFAGADELAQNARFKTNEARIINREKLIPLLKKIVVARSSRYWIDGLENHAVPCGPVNDIEQVFADPQVQARNMKIELPHAGADQGTVDLIANPIKSSCTQVSYRRAPPMLGEHTDEVLKEVLGADEGVLSRLRKDGVVG